MILIYSVSLAVLWTALYTVSEYKEIPKPLYEGIEFTLFTAFFILSAIYFFDSGPQWIAWADLVMAVADGGVVITSFYRYFTEEFSTTEKQLTVKEGSESAWNYHIAERDSVRSLCGEWVMPCALDLSDWNQSYTSTVETVYCEECHQILQDRYEDRE